MLQCVAFLADVSASLVLKETTFLQPQLPTQLDFLAFLFLLGGCTWICKAFGCLFFSLAFCFRLLSNATLIPSKVPD